MARCILSAFHPMEFFMKLLFEFLPIIFFFLTYKFYDIYAATLVAIVSTFAQVGVIWWRTKTLAKMQLATLAIIVVFGGLTLILHDETFIKWKPTVLYWIFAAAIFGSAAFGKNLIRQLTSGQTELPDAAWRQMNLSWGAFFAFMGVANIWVAYSFSTDAWVDFKLYGSIGLMLGFVVIQSFMLSKHIDKEESE